MSNVALINNSKDMAAIEAVLIQGDLAQLKPEQRVMYYKNVCESLGLNPLTKPFDYIALNGRLTLYAKRDCTDQLRNIHKVSIKIIARETTPDGVHIVTAQATLPDGRTDESTGAVPVANLKGNDLANAYLKSETKAKRRVTLSICGMGFLDEVEIDDIPAKDKRAPSGMPLIFPDQPGENDGDPDAQHEWTFPVGMFAKRKLHEVDLDKLRDWVVKNEAKLEKAKTEGKLLDKQEIWEETVKIASDYIAQLETSEVH